MSHSDVYLQLILDGERSSRIPSKPSRWNPAVSLFVVLSAQTKGFSALGLRCSGDHYPVSDISDRSNTG